MRRCERVYCLNSLIICASICFLAVGLAFADGIEHKKVCVKNACVIAEVADSDYKSQAGLMFREELKPEEGMFFIFEEEAPYNFWMKNMKFPLDILWISKESRIVEIKENVPACREEEPCEGIIPQEKAKYVLEVNPGFVEKHKLKVGDRVRF